jgi:hypothetical protein
MCCAVCCVLCAVLCAVFWIAGCVLCAVCCTAGCAGMGWDGVEWGGISWDVIWYAVLFYSHLSSALLYHAIPYSTITSTPPLPITHLSSALFQVTNRYARNLISMLLSKDPSRRPSPSRVLDHPFLSNKRYDALCCTLLLDDYDSVWLDVTVCGCLWTCVTVCDCMWMYARDWVWHISLQDHCVYH